MAAHAQPLFHAPADTQAAAAIAAAPRSAVVLLTRMHEEAVETARLANLLGRALYVAIALGLLATAALAAGGEALAPGVAWAILTGIGCLAIARAYAAAIGRPFERATLQAFAQDLSACLLYAGFAWGAGAFLALPAAATGTIALAFVALPAVAVAALLRERQAALLFLAPVAALTSLACVMRPFADGALAAGIVLIAAAILAWAVHFASRANDKRHGTMPPNALIAS